MTALYRLAGDVDMHVITYTEFGKYLPKSFGMSPDGFIQNAILLTYYKYETLGKGSSLVLTMRILKQDVR